MANINLHNIFCHLTGDDNFLSTVIEADTEKVGKKKSKQKGFNLMANMVTEYIPLTLYETQKYAMFPHKIKQYVTPDYLRMGIKNHMDKDMNVINISFLNSINILLRPELFKANAEEQIRNFLLLEEFICHTIQRNYQIDKVKNTKKIQSINKELIKKMLAGIISHELVQYVVNIFEINLLVFDLTKMDVCLYWTKGTKYPYFNPFKNIYCMAYVQGNYEPIMAPNNIISEEQKRKIYLNILTNLSDIKTTPNIVLAAHSVLYIDSWHVESESYAKIVDIFMKSPKKSIDTEFERLVELETT